MATTVDETALTGDGRKLHYQRQGVGEPVVVFEAGMGVSHHSWGAVIPRVATTTTTIAYDRSGIGQSQPDDQPRTLDRLSHDLTDLLHHLGDGPFVLVGHSWGGPIVRVTAAAMPEQIRGLVLVDQTDEICELFYSRAAHRQTRVMLPLLPAAARLGLLRIPVRRFAAMLPEPAASGLLRDDGTVAAAAAQQAELRSHIDDLRNLRAHPVTLPDVPVTYLSGTQVSRLEGKRRPSLVEAHRLAAAALPQGRHVTADQSSHYIPLTEPDLVAAEILRIVDVARTQPHRDAR